MPRRELIPNVHLSAEARAAVPEIVSFLTQLGENTRAKSVRNGYASACSVLRHEAGMDDLFGEDEEG